MTKSPRPFVIMAIVAPVLFFVTYILMQLAFGAADTAHSGRLMFQIGVFAMFLAGLASIVVTVVGIVGAILRTVRR